MVQILLILVVMVSLGTAQKSRGQNAEWDYKTEAEKVNTRGCANLTLVLDNWKYAIMSQVKDLLLNDHSTVLPDYGRIEPLSKALSELYKEFNALKERLAELTARFEEVESFVDEARAGRIIAGHRDERLQPGSDSREAPWSLYKPRRKKKVVIRRVKKPVKPQE